MSLTPCVEMQETCSICGGPAIPTRWCTINYCVACMQEKLNHATIRVKVIESDGRVSYEDHHYRSCTRCELERRRAGGSK